MSDTPRTEALMNMEFDHGRQIGTITEQVVIDFCRQLEMEVAEKSAAAGFWEDVANDQRLKNAAPQESRASTSQEASRVAPAAAASMRYRWWPDHGRDGLQDALHEEADHITCYASTISEHGPNYTALLLRSAAAEIKRLAEYEWMYKDLCK